MWDALVNSPIFVPLLGTGGVIAAAAIGALAARLTGKAQMKTAQTAARAQVGAEADSLVQTAVELSQGVRSELQAARADLATARAGWDQEKAALRTELDKASTELVEATRTIRELREELHIERSSKREMMEEIHARDARIAELTEQLHAQRPPETRSRATDEDEDGAT